MGFERPENQTNQDIDKTTHESESISFIQDKDDAINFIEEKFEQGERPIVTVKKKRYAEAMLHGLHEHASWDYGEDDLIVGTFCRDSFKPANETEGRTKFRVGNINVNQIRPRFTGLENAFRGVVSLVGPIPPNALEIAA